MRFKTKHYNDDDGQVIHSNDSSNKPHGDHIGDDNNDYDDGDD